MSEDEQTGTKTRLSAARISDIAEAAGVAKGTFYLYFTNKEAVFHHLIDDFFGRLMGETLGRFPASAVMNRGDLAAQLGDMWRLILTRCRQEPVTTQYRSNRRRTRTRWPKNSCRWNWRGSAVLTSAPIRR